MSSSTIEKLLRNTVWNAFARFVHLPGNLFLIPFILGRLGAEQYGIWIALFTLADYFSLLDFGMGAATIKFAAQYNAEGHRSKLGRLLATTSAFNLIFLPPLAVGFIYADGIIQLLNIAPIDAGQAAFVLRWVLVIFGVGQFASVFRGLLIGLQQLHLCNLCEVVYFLLYMAATVLVLASGGGLSEMVVMVFILRVGLAASQSFFAIRAVPNLIGAICSFDKAMFKDFLRYGMKLQMTTLAGLFNFHFDKLLIGCFLRMEFVAFYDIGSKLAALVRWVPSVLMGPLIPAAADLAARKDDQRLGELYSVGTRYISLLAAPAAGLLAANAEGIITLWLAENADPAATLALQTLSIAYFFNIITGALNSIGRGMGVLRYEIEATSVLSFLNLLLSLLFMAYFGFAGVLIGTGLAMTAGNLFYLFRFNAFIKARSAVAIAAALAKPVGCALAAGFISRFTVGLVAGLTGPLGSDRVQVAENLLVSAGVFGVVFCCGLLATRGFTRDDTRLLGRAVAAVRSF